MTETKNPKSLIAAATYVVFFLPMVLKEKDPFVRYHLKQSVGLLISVLALQGIISIIGRYGGPQYLLVWPVRAFLVGEILIGIMNALGNKSTELPLIGKYAARLF